MNTETHKKGDVLAITGNNGLRLGIRGEGQDVFVLQYNNDHTCEFTLVHMNEFVDNIFPSKFYSGKKMRENVGRFAAARAHYRLKTKVPSYLYGEFFDYIVGFNIRETEQHTMPRFSKKNIFLTFVGILGTCAALSNLPTPKNFLNVRRRS